MKLINVSKDAGQRMYYTYSLWLNSNSANMSDRTIYATNSKLNFKVLLKLHHIIGRLCVQKNTISSGFGSLPGYAYMDEYDKLFQQFVDKKE